MQAVEYKSEKTWDVVLLVSRSLKRAFAVDKIDVVIVPALVFDANGYRLGYGKGYYDRFLPDLNKQCFKCGVCYEFQVVNNIYPHPGDVPVHWIVTDHSEIAVDWDFF